MKTHIPARCALFCATGILLGATARGQITETAATRLVAAFDDPYGNVWRDDGPANRSFIHRNGDTTNGLPYNQVAVPTGAVIIAGEQRNVTAAFLSGAAENTGSYGSASGGSASFEVWFEITDTEPDQILFEAGGSGNGTFLGVSDGTLTFFTGGNGITKEEITASITTGWHQVVGVIHRDLATPGNDSMQLYLDGTLVAESAQPVTIGAWAGGNQGGIGRLASSIGDGSSVMLSAANGADGFMPLQGRVAIFRLYNSALTAAQVAEALDLGEGPPPPAVTPPLLQSDLLIAQTRPGIVSSPIYEFDATIFGPLLPWERTGTSQFENFANPPLYDAAPEPVNNPSFPGINAAFDTSTITILGAQGVSDTYENATSPQRSRGNGTFEIWAEFNVGPDSGQQILFECGGSGAGTMFSLNNDQFSFFINGQGAGIENFEILTTITSGWHQIVGVINNTFNATADDSMELFINGVSIGKVENVNINDWAGGNQAGLGNRGGGSHPAESTTLGNVDNLDAPFQGRIAAFRFYNRPLTPEEIQQNFAQMTEPRVVVLPELPGVATQGVTVNGDDAIVDFSFKGGFGANVERSFDLLSFVPVASAAAPPFVDAGIVDVAAKAFYRLSISQTFASFDFTTGDFAADATTSGATQWERGVPTAGPAFFPAGQSVVWATNPNGDYSPNSNAVLRTDALDLGGLESAVINIVHWYDIEPDFPDFISGRVRLVDAATASLIQELGSFNGASVGWAYNSFAVPESALGQQVRLEFVLNSDDEAEPGFLGWYVQSASVQALPESL